jgi:hypothetical protein
MTLGHFNMSGLFKALSTRLGVPPFLYHRIARLQLRLPRLRPLWWKAVVKAGPDSPLSVPAPQCKTATTHTPMYHACDRAIQTSQSLLDAFVVEARVCSPSPSSSSSPVGAAWSPRGAAEPAGTPRRGYGISLEELLYSSSDDSEGSS